LASRTFAPWIEELLKSGYAFHMVFLWLPSEEFAIARVAERVRMGGHDVPEETIRRRYHEGIRNFFNLYRPLADSWFFYDNSREEPRLVAYGEHDQEFLANESAIWHNIKKNHASKRKTKR
jgi:predicted ABC-type ATPase